MIRLLVHRGVSASAGGCNPATTTAAAAAAAAAAAGRRHSSTSSPSSKAVGAVSSSEQGQSGLPPQPPSPSSSAAPPSAQKDNDSDSGSGSGSSSSRSHSKQLVEKVPFFLLDKVLYPKAKLPLVVFEPRYRIMVDKALKSDSKTFGFLSTEKPDPKARYMLETDWQGSQVGTFAKIIHTQRIKGDRLQIEVEGTQRFKVLNKDRDVFGIWNGNVELCDDEGPSVTPSSVALSNDEDVDKATKLVQDTLAMLKKCISNRDDIDFEDQWPLLVDPIVADLEKLAAEKDFSAFSFRLASVLPVDLEKHQRFLSTDNVSDRLAFQLTALVDFWNKHHSSSSSEPAPAGGAPSAK